MKAIVTILVNAAYGGSLLAIFAFLYRNIRGERGRYGIPFALILACFVAGEYFTHVSPYYLGTAIYAVGNFILMVILINLFGGPATKLAGIFIGVPCAIMFTGYYWPAQAQGADYGNVITAGIISVYASNAIIFAMNRIEGKWLFAGIYVALALWMAGYLVIPAFLPGYAGAYDCLLLAAKAILATLQGMVAYRFYRAG